MNKINVGDFIKVKNHLMAVIAEDEEFMYVLINDSRTCQRMIKEKMKGNAEVVKKAACKSIIRAFYDDMTYAR